MTGESGSAERDARNRGLQEEEERLRDQDARPPHGETDADDSVPERPTAPAEGQEGDIGNLENPPQTEGPRERSNDAV
jgi:hypothetical protein